MAVTQNGMSDRKRLDHFIALDRRKSKTPRQHEQTLDQWLVSTHFIIEVQKVLESHLVFFNADGLRVLMNSLFRIFFITRHPSLPSKL